MCLLNTTNDDIALTLANVTEALQELAVNPDSPTAFLYGATISIEQGQPSGVWPHVDLGLLGHLVRENSQAKRDAAAKVAKRFAAKGQPLLPAIASIPVCPTCQNRREVPIGINPDDWTGGTELMGPCPDCVRDDHDLRQFA